MRAPASARVVRLRRWIRLQGSSRGAITRGRPSLRCTSAARSSRSVATPAAMRPTLPMLAGRITMPRVRKLPLAMAAAWSFQRWQRSSPLWQPVRSRQKSSWALGSLGTRMPNSACQTVIAPRLVTSSTRSPASSSNCRARWARGWPEAPDTASTRGSMALALAVRPASWRWVEGIGCEGPLVVGWGRGRAAIGSGFGPIAFGQHHG